MASRRTISQEAPRQKIPARENNSPAPRDIRNALAEAIICLEAALVSSARLAAELLLMHAIDRDRAWIYAHPEYLLTVEQQTIYAELIERRASGEPTQYLTGHQEFWGLEFEVTPAVLIPRPETEHLVEVVLARLKTLKSSDARGAQPLRIADAGTGSGCLAVALAHELPDAQIVATDISAAALEVAQRNAAHHGLSDRIEFRQTNLLDYFEAMPALARPHFDAILSNPPYIDLLDAALLVREIREHEPHQALFAAENGLALYPPLIAQAKTLLTPNGILAVEIARDAAARVRAFLQGPAWTDVATERDLARIERVISAVRSA